MQCEIKNLQQQIMTLLCNPQKTQELTDILVYAYKHLQNLTSALFLKYYMSSCFQCATPFLMQVGLKLNEKKKS